MAYPSSMTVGLGRQKTPEEQDAHQASVYELDNALQSALDNKNTFTQGGEKQVNIKDYNQSGNAGSTVALSDLAAQTGQTLVQGGQGARFQTADEAATSNGWRQTPPQPKEDSKPYDPHEALALYDEIFGEADQKAYEASQDKYYGASSAAMRRQSELNAVSGRSASGGGYYGGLGAAVGDVSRAAGQLESDFYNQVANRKASFLDRQIALAQQQGQFDKVQQLEALKIELGLQSDLGVTSADTQYLLDSYGPEGKTSRING